MAYVSLFSWGVCVCNTLRRCGQSSALGTSTSYLRPSAFHDLLPRTPICCPPWGSRRWRICRRVEHIIAWWAFMVPHFAFLLRTTEERISLLIYPFASLLIVWAADHYRRLTKRLEDEEKFRKLAVEELAHRLKNKIATIQSIISFKLRDNPQARDAIIGCLTALSGTDDLILATQGQGKCLRDILSAETRSLRNISNSNRGTDCVSFAEVSDDNGAAGSCELATNSAKYGSLSVTTGKVAILSVAVGETFAPRMARKRAPPSSPLQPSGGLECGCCP